MGIIGLGNVGIEVAKRAAAFGLNILAFDKFRNDEFAKQYNIKYCDDISEILKESDIISLNISLNNESKHLINLDRIKILKKGVIIVNTARDGLIEHNALFKGLDSKIIRAYLTDVLDEEPMIANHPFLKYSNIIITPHIGSRTYENVEQQGIMAVKNLMIHI
jgi:D-3-phosphoglycerate dehydrogenase